MVDSGWQANSRKPEGLLSNYVYFAIDIPKISYCYACLILKKVDTMVLYITLNHQSGELLPTDPYPLRVMVLCLRYFLRVVTLRALHSECIPLHSFTSTLPHYHIKICVECIDWWVYQKNNIRVNRS